MNKTALYLALLLSVTPFIARAQDQEYEDGDSYYSDDTPDVQWVGPGIYWGVYISNENNYWRHYNNRRNNNYNNHSHQGNGHHSGGRSGGGSGGHGGGHGR